MAFQLIASRWFHLADLFLVSLGGLILYVYPQASWWPLLLCSIPWLIRLAAGYFPFQQTIFDPAIFLFIITAAVGVWATYNREAGWVKFWLILAAIFLFYSLAGQPRENLRTIAGLLCVLSAYISLSFLLSPNLPTLIADFEVIQKMINSWVSLRPTFTVHSPHPNITAGILAMLVPFIIWLGLDTWRAGKFFILVLVLFSGSFTLVGLMMTSSRGAWLALMASTGLISLLLLSKRVAKHLPKSVLLIFGLTLVVLGIQLIELIRGYPGGLVELARLLPGSPSGVSRVELARGALDLIADFPITGGGLGAFAGLYSHYIIVIPHFLFSYSHNLYLDVALEQGLFGFIAFIAILFSSAWLLIKSIYLSKQTNNRLLISTAVLFSLLVIGMHGLVDDAVYGDRAIPLLFLSPGIAIAITQLDLATYRGPFTNPDQGRNKAINLEVWLQSLKLVAIFSLAFLMLFIYFRKPLIATWFSNLGAVRMAQIELAGFPSGKWDDGKNVAALVDPSREFVRSIQVDPEIRTANHRLGLISLLRREFQTAKIHLEAAHAVSPDHRGIIKALGYCYAWLGEWDAATRLLTSIPEARREMEIYIWWWETQNRTDLAKKAEIMAMHLYAANAQSEGNN